MNLQLSALERIFAWRVAKHGLTETGEMIWHMWGGDEPEDADNCLKQIAKRVRDKLRPLGVEIETMHGRGFTTPDRNKLFDVLAAEIEANGLKSRHTNWMHRRTSGGVHVHA